MINLIQTFFHNIGVEKRFNRYLWNTLLVTSAKSFANIFIAVYLWKLKEDFSLILLYYFFLYGTSLISFPLIGGTITKKNSPISSLRFGIIASIVYYSLFLFLGEKVIVFLIPLAIIQGIASSLYYSGDRTLQFDLSSSEKRQNNNTAMIMIRSFASFISPVIAGLIIIRSSNLSVTLSYMPIFIFSTVLYIGAFVNSLFFTKINPSKKNYAPIKTLIKLMKFKDFKLMAVSRLFCGFSFSMERLVIPLLIILISLNELVIGGIESLKIFLSIIAMYFVGKYLKVKRYLHFIIIFSIILFIIYLIPAINPTPTTLFLYAFLVALVYPTLDIIDSTIRNNLLSKKLPKQEILETRIEYIIFIEIWQHIGTIIALIILLLLVNASVNLIIPLRTMVGIIGLVTMFWFITAGLIKSK